MVLERDAALLGQAGDRRPASTVPPLRTTLTVFPFTVISKWFHSPTGLSAWSLGMTAARTSGGIFWSIRYRLDLAGADRPAPDVHLWPSPRRKMPESALGRGVLISLPRSSFLYEPSGRM